MEIFSHDKRLQVSGINLSDILAKLCESHYSHTHELTPANGYLYDQQIGLTKINAPFVAIVLRLADILDFDADRTPDVLFRTIHFSSNISLREWEKHRAIKGWGINENIVRYTAEYTHPAYQAAALKFMDWVDKELSECQNLCRAFPAEFQRYRLLLPSSVDRSRIKPKNNSYICHDLEISLSRNEIIKLLMTDKLYNQPYICIRELLQNSLDALRYRKALFACADIMEWDKGRVDFLHTVDEDGYETIQCKDNGVGMDENIVIRFFTKAGRSFYRSPDFERERVAFKKKGVDFDPCSQFGIGFMSCFMLGDRIKIETRRDYGLGKKYGEPLVIEINGLGGLIIIRKGSDTQEIGTTVTITSRKKPTFLDRWSDKVKLVTVLKHFAVATEFPISGRCNVEELEDAVEIPTTPSYIPTLIEKAGIDKAAYITIEQDFNEIDKNLHGCVRESFLIDDLGLPTLANQVASWQVLPEKIGNVSSLHLSLIYADKSFRAGYQEKSQISIDGILLCGTAGRPKWQDDLELKMYLGHWSTNIECNPYTIDARGNLKPEVTPSRSPGKDSSFHLPPKWKALSTNIHQSAGRLWMKLIEEYVPKGLSSENIWQLFVVHDGAASHIPLNSFWQYLSIPLIEIEKVTWVKVSDLPKLVFHKDGGQWCFKTLDNQYLKFPIPIIEWEKSGVNHPHLQSGLNSVILAISNLSVEDNRVVLSVRQPDDEYITAVSRAISGGSTYIQTLPYINKVKDFISVQAPVKTANFLHPLVQECLSERNNDTLYGFARSFVNCVVEKVCSEKSVNSFEKPDRWMKMVAHRYFAVDWSKYQESRLKPPYKFWLEDGSVTEITENDLKKWRDSKVN